MFEVLKVGDLPEGMRGCVLGGTLDKSDDLFLGSEWLDVCLVGICCPPDGYCSNEVGEDLAVVYGFECSSEERRHKLGH